MGVVSNLLSKTNSADYANTIRLEYKDIAERHAAQRAPSRRLPIADARANKAKIEWKGYTPPKPSFLGVKEFGPYDLGELAEYIDWTPFFRTWELVGPYPQILDDDKVGEAARGLFKDAQAMLKKIVDEKWLTAKGVIGFWPAAAQGDDIVLYTDDSRKEELTTLHTLRQQMVREGGRPNLALADFVAPQETGLADYIGGFAVTTGLGEDEHIKRFEADKDDYSAILLRALADRLAEAFAERMHARVRREFWGYAPDENLSGRGSDRREISGHPSGAGLSRPARSHREGHAVRSPRSHRPRRHHAHRELCHVAGLGGVGALFLASRKPLFRHRQDRARSGRGLCEAQGYEP